MKNRIIKSLSVFSLVMCMLVAGLPVQVLATEVKEDTEVVLEIEEEGYVIPEDAIYLSTEEDLLSLVEDCRLDTWSIGKVVVLNNDIELSSSNFQGIPTFGGIFLGQGYSIKGLYIEEEGSAKGFFRYLQKTAIVSDLHLEGNVVPEGSRCVVGGIAGENAGYIIHCSFEGNVSGVEQVGGIAGINKTTGTIHNCKVTGTVDGRHFIGGIVGENHGVVRMCENHAKINTESVQNAISVEEITMESMVNTEVSNTATNIGGIAGDSSGVIRKCINKGTVGYKNMGYNVGGIAGSQKGYLVDCINYADVQGRKEVGGIVGQIEPNIVLDYNTDSLQMLNSQMTSIEKSLKGIEHDLENSELETQMDGLQVDMENVQNALSSMYDTEGMPEVDNWEDMENWESEDFENWEPEDFENWEPEDFEDWEPAEDQNTAARNDLSNALDALYSRTESMANSGSDTSEQIIDKMENIASQLGKTVNTMSTFDSNMGYSMEDVSDEDTVENTIGKVAGCVNYGDVKGDLNIGGIAGIIAKENDLDEYQDTDINGDESLNATYETRAVVRGCRNLATIAANKQAVGGIVGQAVTGAIIECVNIGNIDAINADYVGGIAGDSYTLIRDCGSRAIISGDAYVGGIAGNGREVTGCYSFTDIKAYTEKAGAVLGYVETILEEEDADISENCYFIAGNEVGGIDGIGYEGVTDKLNIEEFLALEDLDEAFRSVSIRFEIEDKEDVVITAAVGETISMERVPVLSTENATEYAWEVVPAVTSEILEMGEVKEVEYLSAKDLENVMFDQTYEAVFDAKATVVKGTKVNDNNLAVILAGGIFARDTSVEMTDMLSRGTQVDGKTPIVHWGIELSNTGVETLHYLIPEEVNPEKVKLFVKDASETWTEREFAVDVSYMVFDFTDEDTEFALVADYVAIALDILLLVIVAAVIVTIVTIIVKQRKKKKANK